jgi:N-hydroxyarylamine O-acetyltransferase
LRIGYSGDRTPTLGTLQTINRLHPQAIPFENLNTLMKWPVGLDAESLQQKLVRDGRGGYCYEHNLLFSHVLKALGFQVKELSGRAVWNQPENALTARTHVVLMVELDGEDYVVDVGYGVATMTAPLRLETDVEQTTPHEPWQIIKRGDDFVVKMKMGDKWVALYRFDLQEQFLSDFELMNWYTSTHPKSLFVNNLMVARADGNCRHSLLNNTVTARYLDGVTERRAIQSAAELRKTLKEVFHMDLPEAHELDMVLNRVVLPSG